MQGSNHPGVVARLFKGPLKYHADPYVVRTTRRFPASVYLRTGDFIGPSVLCLCNLHILSSYQLHVHYSTVISRATIKYVCFVKYSS